MNKVQKFLIRALSGKRDIVDLSGSQNIFGTLGSGATPIISSKHFIPKDSNGGTISLLGNSDSGAASWIGLNSPQMQLYAYQLCSPLSSIIDRLAEADTNGKIEFVDADTEVKIKSVNKNPRLSRIRKLFTRPNPWQTWMEFDAEQVVLCKIFGCCPVFAVGPAGFDKSYTKALINLPRHLITPVRNENFSLFGTQSRIKEWTLTIFGKPYTIPTSDIILIKDGFISTKMDEFGLPLSKIEGLDFFVSNVMAAMEANNVILRKKGPLGVFSFDPGKDMAGATPLDPTAKDDLQTDLMRYGLTVGQIQYVISKMPIKWNAMSFNLRDLMTKEIIRDAIDGMSDRFNYPAELMSGKNATYENRSSSEKFVYQNNIIPFSLRRMLNYNNFFELEEVVLRKNFNHLAVLQEDIVKAGEAEKYESESLMIEWTAGQITWNQWQVAKGRDTVEGMDIYYPEYIVKFPQMNKQVNPAKNKKKNENTPPKDTGAA